MKKIDKDLINEYEKILKNLSEFKKFSNDILDNSELETIIKILDKAEIDFNSRKNYILSLYKK